MDKQDLKELEILFGGESLDEVLPLFNKIYASKSKDIQMFSNKFYSYNIYSKLEEKLNSKSKFISSNGYFKDAERKMLSFNGSEDEHFPISCIKIITPKKFNNLTHRDYLGSILSLGIERNSLGDVRVVGNECYFVTTENLESYILSSLKKIKNLACKCECISDNYNLPKLEFEEKVIITSSLRIDCIVKSITNMSRSDAQKFLLSNNVMVNYINIREKNLEITPSTRITLRGYGKYIIEEIVGKTKNDRFKIKIKKFI